MLLYLYLNIGHLAYCKTILRMLYKSPNKMWKITYGLAIVKEGEQEPIKVKYDEDDVNQEGAIEGGTDMHIDD